jgi:hypothetical protein
MSSNEPGAGRGSDEAVRGNRPIFARLRDQFTPAWLREVRDRFVRAMNRGRGAAGRGSTHPQNDNLGRNPEPDIAELMGDDDAGLRAARERPELVANMIQAEQRAQRLQAANERASQIPPPYENPEQDVTLINDGRSVAQLEWEASQAQRTSRDGDPEPTPQDGRLPWAALSRNMASPRAPREGIPRGWGNEPAPLYPVAEGTTQDRGGAPGPESPIPSDPPPYTDRRPYMYTPQVGHQERLPTAVRALNEGRDPSAALQSWTNTRALPQEWLDRGSGPESPLVGEQKGARVVTDATRSRRSSIEGQIREERDARQGRGSSEHEM